MKVQKQNTHEKESKQNVEIEKKNHQILSKSKQVQRPHPVLFIHYCSKYKKYLWVKRVWSLFSL